MAKLICNGKIIQEYEFPALYPNTSFAYPIDYSEFGWDTVFDTPVPDYLQDSQEIRELPPVMTVKGHWEQQWGVFDLPPASSPTT